MVVTFGDEEPAKKWKEKTGCTFRILLDPDKNLYHYVGLDRPLLTVCV